MPLIGRRCACQRGAGAACPDCGALRVWEHDVTSGAGRLTCSCPHCPAYATSPVSCRPAAPTAARSGLSRSMPPIRSLKAALRWASRTGADRVAASGASSGRRRSHQSLAVRGCYTQLPALCAHSLSHWRADRRAALWWAAARAELSAAAPAPPSALLAFLEASPADGATQLQQAATLLPSGAQVYLAWATRVLSHHSPGAKSLLTGVWRAAVCFGA